MTTQNEPIPARKCTAAVRIYKEANRKRSRVSENGAEKLKIRFSKNLKRILRKTVAGVAVCSMLTGLLPGQALMVRAETVNKHDADVSSMGVSGIKNPVTNPNYNVRWKGDYVYYGGHLFRVLDTDTTDFSADDGILPPKHTMLLDSDSVIGEVSGDHIHFDNDGKPNQGAERANEWEYSDLKAWLNDSSSGFLAQFSKTEIKGIASSTKPDPVTGDGNGFSNTRYAPLKDDRVFVLDAVEASRSDYGYSATSGDITDETDTCSRVKTSDGSYGTMDKYVPGSGIWWLRSPIYNPKYPNHAGYVFGVNQADAKYFYSGGYFGTNSVNYSGPGPSPALNVDLDSVLLSTCIKSKGLAYGNEYKLTLICDGLETAITPGQSISVSGNTVTVPFTVTDKDQTDGIEADCISVLVVRGNRTNGEITKYEQLTSSLNFDDSGTASGTVDFSLPSEYSRFSDHIYVFAEDMNEGIATDYASAPLALMQPGAASGLVYDGDSHSLLNDDVGTIPSGYTAVYALSDSEPAEENYKAEIPTARDAGIHCIWYKLMDTENTTVFGPISMTVAIAKKRVGVSGITATEKQYDGKRDVTLTGGTLNPSDIISGDELSIAALEGRFKYADAGADKPVTITKITLDGTSKDNYAPYAEQSSLSGKVTQKPVTVTGISAENKTYDGTKTATLITDSIQVVSQIDGVVDVDDFSVYNLTVSKKTAAQFENAAVGTDKTVNLEPRLGGYCSGNYKVSADSQKTVSADITPRSITIRANDQSVGPGGTVESGADSVSVTSGSLVDGHSISAVTLTSSATDTLTDAGTITATNIVIRDADGNVVTDNYSITTQDGVLTVTEEISAKVTAAPKASAITYGQTLKDSALTLGTGNVAGTFAWADNTIAPSVSNNNTTEYDVIFTPTDNAYNAVTCKVKVTVNRKSVEITGVTASDKEYDGTTEADVTGTPVLVGKLDGDDLSYSAGSAAFEDADVGENKEVSFSGWSLIGSASGNYILSAQPAPVKAAITPKSITGAKVTLSATQKRFTGLEQSVSVSSVKLGDMTLTPGVDYEVKSGTSGTAVNTYTVTVTGKGNYKDDATADWEITDKIMGVSAPDVTETYDGTAHGITVSMNDLSSGYTIKYGSFEDTYDLDASPTITGVSESPKTVYFKVTAANCKDYTGSATITITPRPVTVSGIKAGNKDYDGSAAAQLDCTGVSFNGIISGDTLTVSANGEFADADAGTKKTVNISSLTLSGNSAENYVLAKSGQQTEATADILKVNIPADSITGPGAITDLTYDGSAKALITAGSCDYGTMWYAVTDNTVTTAPEFDGDSDTEDKKWGTSVPMVVKAGNYYVWYRVRGDENHKDYEGGKQEVKIARGDPVYTDPGALKLEYNGLDQELVSAGSVTLGSDMEYSVSVNGTYSAAIPTGKNAGDYTVYYRLTETGDVNGIEPLRITVTIAGKQATVTADDKSKSEGDEEPQLTATVTGLVEGENESLISYDDLYREAGETAGQYVITVSGDKVQGNYEVSYKSGIFTISERKDNASSSADKESSSSDSTGGGKESSSSDSTGGGKDSSTSDSTGEGKESSSTKLEDESSTKPADSSSSGADVLIDTSSSSSSRAEDGSSTKHEDSSTAGTGDKEDSGSSSDKGDSSSTGTGDKEDSGSSSDKGDSGSSSDKGDSSSTGTGGKEDSSSTGTGDKEDSGSSSDKGDSSSTGTGGKEGSSSAGSGEKEVNGSSSENAGNGSSDEKDIGTSSSKKAPKAQAEDARDAGRGSLEENEATVKAQPQGKKNVYRLDAETLSKTGETVLTLTMAKKDRVQLPGYDKKTLELAADARKKVKISNKGVLTAAKDTGDGYAQVSYTNTVTGQIVKLNVRVLTPKLIAVGEGAVIGKNGLSATVSKEKEFDLILDAPLTSFANAAKSSTKGGVTIADPEFISVGSEGRLHITGKADGKGSAKIVFEAYGKSYTAKISAK